MKIGFYSAVFLICQSMLLLIGRFRKALMAWKSISTATLSTVRFPADHLTLINPCGAHHRDFHIPRRMGRLVNGIDVEYR